MKRFYPVFAALLLFPLLSSAQAPRNCGTTEHMQWLTDHHPEIAINLQQMEAFTRQFEQSGGNKTNVVYTIPVVVHVVYNTAPQNISDAQINSQITVLNQDYRRLNADAV